MSRGVHPEVCRTGEIVLDVARIQSVLVHAPNWVGDLVMATPALRAVRASFPGAHVAVMCRRLGTRILAGAPWFDELIPFDRHGEDRGPGRWLGHARRLRKRRFDLALVLPNSLSSGLLAWGAGCRLRVGYGNGRSLLLTHSLFPEMEGRRRRPRYMVDYYADLLAFLGLDPGDRRLELFVTAEEEEACARFLRRHGLAGDRILALNPGASFGPSKLWRTDRFAEVADRLVRSHGLRAVALCGPGEESLAREIVELMKEPCVDTSRDRVGLDLLKPFMKRVALLLTTDTGARHFAVAFSRPVVVVMGSTDPRYTDGNLERTRVLREPVVCSPCHLKICPIDHRCMERLSSTRVLEACEELLDPTDVADPTGAVEGKETDRK